MTENQQNTEKEYPPLSHACVGVIVYRDQENSEREYLIQKRDKPGTPYHEKLEFPVGILEDSQNKRDLAQSQALREVYEESGLSHEQVRMVDQNTTSYSTDKDEVIGFTPFFQTHQIKGGNPWIMSVFLAIADSNAKISDRSDETKDVHWIKESELKQKLTEHPEEFFPLQVPAWKYLLKIT